MATLYFSAPAVASIPHHGRILRLVGSTGDEIPRRVESWKNGAMVSGGGRCDKWWNQ